MREMITQNIIEDWKTGTEELVRIDKEGYRYYQRIKEEGGVYGKITALPPFRERYYEGYGNTIEEAYEDLINQKRKS